MTSEATAQAAVKSAKVVCVKLPPPGIGVFVGPGVFVGCNVLVGSALVAVGVFVGVLVGVFVGSAVKVGVLVGVCVAVGVFTGTVGGNNRMRGMTCFGWLTLAHDSRALAPPVFS
jgi:hypothetical protein